MPPLSLARANRLQDLVTAQAERRPDARALVMDDEVLTYGELEVESNRLAHALRESGCRAGDRVCLLTPKTPAAILAMVATLKAGCAYVPIDTASPAPRVEMIVRQSDPRAILVTSSGASLLDGVLEQSPQLAACAIGSLEHEPVTGARFASAFSQRDWWSYPRDRTGAPSSGDDIAHLLFTSGSTGVPKGVVITHANVLHFVAWAIDYFGMAEDDRNSGHPPLHFDLSTFDVYGAFATGATLFPVPASINLLPHKLAGFIGHNELTQWFSVPSVMTYLAKFDALASTDFSHLRRVLWCGDVLPTPTLVYWMERLPHAAFTNLYGPTEATIASSYYTVPRAPGDETESIPIGTPCGGEELLVLDERLGSVPDGEIGDLYIAGVGLSPGYWRDQEKTAAAFVPDPRPAHDGARIYRTGDLARVEAGGLVQFVGRADSQVKSRGYRIELGEIETAVNAIASLRECAVVGVRVGGFEGTMICCAYVPQAGATLEPAQVRTEIGRTLPSYMIPSQWLVLDQLPQNANGKIDRKRVREVFEERLPTGT